MTVAQASSSDGRKSSARWIGVGLPIRSEPELAAGVVAV
jgi:hypothetical protein